MEIHQFLAGFMPGDAISNYALELQKILRGWGYTSDIFVLSANLDPRMINRCKVLETYRRYSSPDTILIYHFAIGSEATVFFLNIPAVKIVIYHNITPADFFVGVKPEMAEILNEGRRELLELSSAVNLAVGVSEYNRRELQDAGFNPTGTISLTLDWSSLDGKPSRALRLKYYRSRDNILFIGRIVPNKRIEDLLKAFFYYKLIKPRANLFLVGNYGSDDKYYKIIQSFIAELQLKDIVITGHVTHAQLLAYYKLASVYLCLSEHEGFCMPLMEAMHFGIPVMAYAAAAVPDTMKGAGVLIREKNYPEIAEMAALLCDDEKFRQAIIDGQYRRLQEFKSISLEEQLKEHLGPWLG